MYVKKPRLVRSAARLSKNPFRGVVRGAAAPLTGFVSNG